MIDLLISIFCRIDDFCTIYEKHLKHKQIGEKKKRQYDCKAKLSTSKNNDNSHNVPGSTLQEFQGLLQRFYWHLLERILSDNTII